MPQNSFWQNMQTDSRIRTFAVIVLAALALYLVAASLGELKSYRYIGSGVTATNTITVSGEGEVLAVPDTATFSVTIQETAEDVESAQEVATQKANDIIAYLREAGVEEKNIQTADYSIYPEYEWVRATCVDGYCPEGRQNLVGYQVSQSISVKVSDTEMAGDLLSGVGSRGASSVSGLSFTIDDEDALQAAARDKAILDARAKAEELADSLDVRIVRVVGFSESGSYPPVPYAARGSIAMDAQESSIKLAAPELPTGQNKIISNVSVTWEIR
jgi:hypothetical protein